MLGQAAPPPPAQELAAVVAYLHVPTTFALIAALSAHVVSVFFYW